MSPEAKRARDRERIRRWRAQRTAAGRCHGSGCRTLTDSYYCLPCAVRRSHVQRAILQRCRERRSATQTA